MKYRAFISYSHRDKAWGDWLHRALETYRVPKPLVGRPARGGATVPSRIFPVFRDREELPTSADLGKVIQEALRQSQCLIVICSPHAAKSRWVNEEILHYKRLGRESSILALIVDGEPNASEKEDVGKHRECFPRGLRFQLGPEGDLSNTPTEPIAADARPEADGKTNALLKLAAGILGVDYDALKRRDELRRRRVQRTWLAVSLSLLVLFASLAGVALHQWSEAETARQVSEERRLAAERAEKDALLARDDARTTLARSLHQQGMESWQREDRAEAVAYFTSAYRLKPEVSRYGATLSSLLLRPPEGLSRKPPFSIPGVAIQRIRQSAIDEVILGTLGGGAVQIDIATGGILSQWHHPDGGVVLAGSDGPPFLMALSDGQQIRLWRDFAGFNAPPFLQVAFEGVIFPDDLRVAGDGGKILSRSSLAALMDDSRAVVVMDVASEELTALALPDQVEIDSFEPIPQSDRFLLRLTTRGVRMWCGQQGITHLFEDDPLVTSTAVSDDGRLLALALQSGPVRIVGTAREETYTEVAPPSWSGGGARYVSFSPDGSSLAVVWYSVNARAHFLQSIDTATGEPGVHQLAHLRRLPEEVVYSTDNKLLYVSYAGGDLHLYEAGFLRYWFTVRHGSGRVLGGFLEPSGGLWTAGDDGWIRYWNPEVSRVGPLRFFTGWDVQEVRLNEELDIFALRGDRNRVHQLWRLREMVPLHDAVYHSAGRLAHLYLSPAWQGVMVQFDSNDLESWNHLGEKTGRRLYSEHLLPEYLQMFGSLLFGHFGTGPTGEFLLEEGRIYMPGVVIPNHLTVEERNELSVILAERVDGALHFLDPETLQSQGTHALPFPPVFSRLLPDGVLYTESMSRFEGIHRLQFSEEGISDLPTLASPDSDGEGTGGVAMIAERGHSEDGGVSFFRVGTTRIDIHHHVAGKEPVSIATTRSIRLSRLSPDGRFLALAFDSGTARHPVRIYRTEDGSAVTDDLEQRGRVRTMEFSPDNRWLFTGGNDQMVRVWCVADGAPALPPLEQTGRVLFLHWSKASQELLVVTDEGECALWALPADHSPPAWLEERLEALWELGLDDQLHFVSIDPGKKLKPLLEVEEDCWWGQAYQAAFDNQPVPRFHPLADTTMGRPRPDPWHQTILQSEADYWAIFPEAVVRFQFGESSTRVQLRDLRVRGNIAVPFLLDEVSVSWSWHDPDGRWGGVEGTMDAVAVGVEIPHGVTVDLPDLEFEIPGGRDYLRQYRIAFSFQSEEGGLVPVHLPLRFWENLAADQVEADQLE